LYLLLVPTIWYPNHLKSGQVISVRRITIGIPDGSVFGGLLY
jgi:hypothetical protein